MVEPTELVHLSGRPVEYRLSRAARGTGPTAVSGPAEVVLVMHGGHMRAGIPFGESGLRAAGWAVLVPSRPGYGRTAVSTGPDPDRFADTTAQLCAHLGVTSLRAVVGVSAGGPAAAALAARHPHLVRSLLLVSARSSLPFPTGATRLAAHLAFGPRLESRVWGGMRALLRHAPEPGLRLMLASMSTLPARQVLADLSTPEREELTDLFATMRSGRGFAVDVRHRLDADLGRAVTQPTLIIASPDDGQVGWQHAERWHQQIRGSVLWRSPSLSHLVWYGASGAAVTEQRIIDFLEAP